jgi:hypothetical protein
MVTQVNVSPKGILLDDLHLRTDNSYLHLDLHMLFDSYSAISSFVDSVTFDNVIYPTDVMLSDLGPFTEVLYKMPDNIHFEGIMKGPVRKFTVDKLKLDLGEITDLVPLERGKSGRIWKLQIVGTKRTFTIGKELEIRRALSESHLYSSAFDVERKGDRFILKGKGWGHGVGLCQIGAAVMGEQGYNYEEILLYYYRGAEVKRIYR